MVILDDGFPFFNVEITSDFLSELTTPPTRV